MITQNDLSRLFGTDVYEQDGSKIGSAGQVYLDNSSGEPEWVSVKTGLFGTKESFVPLQKASLTEDRIVVPFSKDQVKNAPRVDADGDLSPAEEQELYRYYGLDYGTADYDNQESTDTIAANYATRDETDYDTTRTAGDDASRVSAGDGAMTRSEERLRAGTRTEEAGKARLRKYVVTERQQVEVPVQREEVRLEREPITDANRGPATSGPDITESEHEVTLRAERPVVDTEAVPVERVRLNKETVQDTEQVQGEVRKEQIDYDGPDRR
jgi:uncharacterized protein (TIGR02271 family)